MVESWTRSAIKEYKTCSPGARKRIKRLITDIKENPFAGLGRPKMLWRDGTLLFGDTERMWSRRISAGDRLVYAITDGTVIIYTCKGHYYH